MSLGASAWKLDSALKQPLNLTQEQLLDVPAGATPTGTFNRLEADGVLDDAFWLRLYWRFNLDGQPLHSGEYRMTPGHDRQGLIGLWQRGEVVQYSLDLGGRLEFSSGARGPGQARKESYRPWRA